MAVIVGAVGGVSNNIVVVVINLFMSLFTYGIVINLTLMAFNLLPIYPLDGFHVVEAFTKYENKYCVFMRRYGQFVLFGLLILGSIMSRIGLAVGGSAGRIIQSFDFIGSYIRLITGSVESLFNIVASAILG